MGVNLENFVSSPIINEILSTSLRLLLALVCGGLLGLERGKKRRPAGFRTHMLVCTGAALAMVTNQYMASVYPGIDASRMGAQVISGMGFLGAGTIMVTGLQRIRGLTTAAGLWVVACIGLAFGTGFYSGGIIATVLCFAINTVLHKLESRVNSVNPILNLYMELDDISYIGKFLSYAKNNQIQVSELETGKARSQDNRIGVMTVVKLNRKMEHQEVLSMLGDIEGVCYIEEVNN